MQNIKLGVTAENPVRMSQKTMIQLFYNEIQIRGGYSTKLKIHTACLIRVINTKVMSSPQLCALFANTEAKFRCEWPSLRQCISSALKLPFTLAFHHAVQTYECNFRGRMG